MEPTVEKKWACLQRREWNSGPCGAIERLPGGSFAVRVAAGPGWKGCLFFLYASTESGLRGAVWQRSIGNFIEHLEGFSEHGIFHGITAYPNK